MSYATPDDLAGALEIRVTAENSQLLQDCLDAAASEIDWALTDCTYVVGDPEPTAILKRVNVNRAVEWYKAPATYNGGVGMPDTGVLNAPTSGFGRHWAAMQPLRHAWGVA
jgi:hypothetical protein